MTSIIGIDSRIFVRSNRKAYGVEGHFESVIGIAVKVKGYESFNEAYKKAMLEALKKYGIKSDYSYYCTHDLTEYKEKNLIIEEFIRIISPDIEKIHVFYTLFSKKRIPEPEVYGRLAHRKQIKLSKSTMTYEELLKKHLVQCFPIICAWRITPYMKANTIEFHMDAYQGKLCEAEEDVIKLGFKKRIFVSGDMCNPVISTADLVLQLLDFRLAVQNKYLIFENIRPALPEFGDKVMAYPILNKHLPKITPIDTENMEIDKYMQHPIFWIFKGDSIINSETLKSSKMYRCLVDYASANMGTVKLFSASKDIRNFEKGDFGVYLENRGKEQIQSYVKLDKPFKLFDLNLLYSEKKTI